MKLSILNILALTLVVSAQAQAAKPLDRRSLPGSIVSAILFGHDADAWLRSLGQPAPKILELRIDEFQNEIVKHAVKPGYAVYSAFPNHLQIAQRKFAQLIEPFHSANDLNPKQLDHFALRAAQTNFDSVIYLLMLQKAILAREDLPVFGNENIRHLNAAIEPLVFEAYGQANNVLSRAISEKQMRKVIANFLVALDAALEPHFEISENLYRHDVISILGQHMRMSREQLDLKIGPPPSRNKLDKFRHACEVLLRSIAAELI